MPAALWMAASLATGLSLAADKEDHAQAARQSAKEARSRYANSLDQRTLAGHRFVSSSMLDDPFVSPYVGADTEYGVFRTAVDFKNGDEINLDMLQAAQLSSLQLAFFERVAIRGEVAAAFQAAQDPDTALYSTVNGGISGAGHLKAKVWGNDRFQLGASTGMWQGRTVVQAPYNGLLKLLQRARELASRPRFNPKKLPTAEDVAADMFEESTSLDAYGGVSGAAGIHPTTGVWTSAQLAYGRSLGPAGDLQHLFWRVGGGVSLSAQPVVPEVPIGLVLAYMIIMPAESTAGRGKEYRAGLFYTGREYMDVGVELTEHIDTAEPDARNKQTWQYEALDLTQHSLSVRTRVRVYF